MEIKRLKNCMELKCVTYEEMAQLCGINYHVFEERMEQKSEFTLGEIEIIANRLGMNEIDVNIIFF